METIKIKSPTQPIENAEVFDIYNGSEKRAICIIANEGYELIKENDEPSNICSVDIPAMYEERVNLYKAIPKIDKEEDINGNY